MIIRRALLVHLFVILCLLFGAYSIDEQNNKQEVISADDHKTDDKSGENDVTEDSPNKAELVDKRSTFSGSILGSGLLNGKRDDHTTDGELEKRYGFLLGNRFAFGKRDLELPVDIQGSQFDAEYTKKWLGDVYGGSYDMYKRSKRDTHEKRFIRYFGNVLGRGFAFGKRDGTMGDGNDFMMQDGDEMPGDLVYLVPLSDDDGEQLMIENDKRYFDSSPGYRFDFGKREGLDDEDQDKRYFNSDVGGRFNFGKKSGEEDNIEKRYGFVLGKGYAFGKRGNDKRYFGHVLGNGFSFGKRSSRADSDEAGDMDASPVDEVNMAPISKRYGWLLGRGWRSDKRGNKRFGWVLGKGRSFGKRSGESGDDFPNEMYFIDDDGNIENIDKRFAFNQGYKLAGKNPKRYGFVLGKGYSFGKRSQVENTDGVGEGPMGMDKRYGFVLGKGYSFGKRSANEDGREEDVSDKNKRYGFVLGRGFSFGKRGQVEDGNEGTPDMDKRYGFLLGRGFSFGKRGEQKSEETGDDDEMKMNKRYGFLLGRSFAFGKRGFGSVLGGGYSFGKRSGDSTLESMKL